MKVSETTWHIFPMLHFQANLLFPCEHSVRRDWQVHLKKLFMYGDNFFQECDGEQFWFWIGSWMESVMQRFDGVL